MKSNEAMGGAALLIAAAGTVAGMAHHPAGTGAGFIGPAVHGALLLFLVLTAYGFASFAAARGAGRPPILAGLVCYAVAMSGHIAAATINGFIVPALAARNPKGIAPDILGLTWHANQALATLGVVAASGAILLWSFDFLSRPGRETRILGGSGLIAGLGVPVLLATDAIDMNLTGAFIAYALHAGWGAAVGFHLIRGRARAS